MRVSFVCSGNICRSPTAELVMASMVQAAVARGELPAGAVEVESAGTGAWHVGDDMDPRSRAELRRRGYAPGRHTARQFEPDDFDRLDLVVALDRTHRDDLRALARDDDERARVVLLGELGTAYRDDPSVPDPYYGGASGFADVVDRVEDGCRGLLERCVDDAAGRG